MFLRAAAVPLLTSTGAGLSTVSLISKILNHPARPPDHLPAPQLPKSGRDGTAAATNQLPPHLLNQHRLQHLNPGDAAVATSAAAQDPTAVTRTVQNRTAVAQTVQNQTAVARTGIPRTAMVRAAETHTAVATGVIVLSLVGLLSLLSLLPLTLHPSTGRHGDTSGQTGTQTGPLTGTPPPPEPEPEPEPEPGVVFCSRAGSTDGCPRGRYCSHTRSTGVFVCARQVDRGELCYSDYQCRSGYCAPRYPIGRCW